DNQPVIDLIKGNGLSSRNRHIQMEHDFLNDLLQAHEIQIQHIGTKLEIADSLTQ
ncbi:hypothetical protein ROZALSC1DRAFT_9131, partial [Rozella allomycis CSF55]